jgi:hypothetical protein
MGSVGGEEEVCGWTGCHRCAAPFESDSVLRVHRWGEQPPSNPTVSLGSTDGGGVWQ